LISDDFRTLVNAYVKMFLLRLLLKFKLFSYLKENTRGKYNNVHKLDKKKKEVFCFYIRTLDNKEKKKRMTKRGEQRKMKKSYICIIV